MGMEFEGRMVAEHIVGDIEEAPDARTEFPQGIITAFIVMSACGVEDFFMWSYSKEELALSNGEIKPPLKVNDHYIVEYTGDGNTRIKKAERREEDGMGE
jgi:hypothetical protein